MKLIRGEFISTDASAPGSESAARVTLYPAGSTTALASLGAGEFVVVTDVTATTGTTGMAVEVYDGADAAVDAGERVARFPLAANQTAVWASRTPHFCQAGTWPKVRTSVSGAVTVVLRGYLATHLP